MEKYFLPRHEKIYFLFTDHDDLKVPNNVVKVYQDELPWPYVTLKSSICKKKSEESLTFYSFLIISKRNKTRKGIVCFKD